MIVVGAGSAGCALAARLSENSARRVLVLEAGPYYGRIDEYPQALQRSNVVAYSLPGDPHSWPFLGRLTPTVNYPLTRGKVFGGSSAVNGCLFTRGHPDDYDGWAKAGNDEWSYAKVLPYFKKLESDLDFGETAVHGADGPIPVKRASEDNLSPVSHAFVAASIDHGYRWDADLNAPGSGGIGCFPTNSIDGLRQNVSSSYIEPAVTRANLIIRDRALARRVIFERSRAVGVEATVDGRLKTFRGDEIVLCAGGLKSPQLLMLSGIGPEPMLRGLDIPLVHASPFVGKGLMDDPGINIPFGISSAARTEAGRTLAEVCLNFAHPDCGSQEDLKLMVINYNWFMLLFGNMRGGSIAGRLGAASFLTRPRSTFRGFRGTSPTKLRQDFRTRNDLTMKCGIGPEASRGELRLVSANHEIPPEINLHYFSEPTDLRRMRAVVRTGCELLESRAFRSVGAVRKGLTGGDLRSDAALDAWIMSNLVTASHSSSTAKMGPPSDESAVVDQHCRVYGVDGLRVVDLSILPQLTRRGPNATAVMLGERAAGFFGD